MLTMKFTTSTINYYASPLFPVKSLPNRKFMSDTLSGAHAYFPSLLIANNYVN